ncbi:hypothetical protein [Bacillus sp. FJAT-27251]|uniref:hypothetical protein n=1 Tax=Bacillus sp. FJAT-27251 TaxID=1684142 RepID=UPI0006A7AB30|nr:hypothetical protein [Bacillus sp. FJAT-27251]
MEQEKMMHTLEKLADKINSLEASIHDRTNPPIIVKVDVKELHLNELTLEELAFHLDKLDIKEISGMLNLGNTFSPRVHPKSKPKQPPSHENPEPREEEELNEIQVQVNHKSVPYTITEEKGD